MGRKILLVLLLSSLGGIFFLCGADRDIALIYLKNIEKLWPDDREGAFRLIDDGLSYDDTLSGLWFFQGLYEFGKEDYLGAEQSLDRAWQDNDWEGGDIDRFIDLYFPLLSRLGRWEKILEAERGTAFHRVNKKEVILAAGWADFFLGHPGEAGRYGRRGIELYPDDWRFYSLALAGGRTQWIPTLLYKWADDGYVMGRIFDRLYKNGVLDDELSSWYRNQNGPQGDFLNTVETLRLSRNNASRTISSYLDRRKPTDLFLLYRISLLAEDAGLEVLNRYLLDNPGSFSYDGDGDSYPEMLLTGDKILLSDRDRDSLWDTRISLDEGGIPLKWESLDSVEDRNFECRFYRWPYVEEVVRGYKENSQSLAYLYPRFSLTDGDIFPADLFHDRDTPRIMELASFIREGDIRIPYHTLLAQSRSISERKAGMLARKYYVVEGEVIAYEEDPDLLGKFTRQVLIDDGLISAARRDLDGDGTFDLFEYYEAGVWSGYAVNYKGDGYSDFFEDWSFIPLKIWDYDGDSLMDGLMAESYGEEVKTIIPHREDPRDIGDYLSWERKFEAQWYR